MIAFSQSMEFIEIYSSDIDIDIEILHGSYTGDNDGDGRKELFFRTGDIIRILEAIGDDSFELSYSSMALDIDDMKWALGDVDDDGIMEYWIGRYSSPFLSVFENRGDDVWDRVSTIFLTGSSQMPAITCFDEDNDGDIELIAARNASPININVFDNISDDVFDLDHNFTTGSGFYADLFEPGFDSDGDGALELMVKLTSSSGGFIAWQIYEAGGLIYDTRSSVGRVVPLAKGDIDGDGDDEIIVKKSTELLILDHRGGLLQAADTLSIDARSASCGELSYMVEGEELIIESESDSITVFGFHDGDFIRLWGDHIDEDYFPFDGISTGDLDDDGKPDFAFSGNDGNIHIFEASRDIACSAYVDIVSIEQETDCDSLNLIEICYSLESFCSGSLWTVDAEISADGIDFYDIIDSIISDDGDFGEGVMIGEHCFEWVFSNDLPDTSGEFTLRILIDGSDEYDDFDIFLDSEAPEIGLFCPDVDSVMTGDSLYFEWSSSEAIDSYRIEIELCDDDSAYSIVDSSTSLIVPSTDGCEYLVFYLTASDSFCNTTTEICSLLLYEDIAITASIAQPSDLNGDGRIIATCDDFEIRWAIDSDEPIDLSSIETTIGSVVFDIDSTWLFYEDDTLTFSPPMRFWEDYDSIYFCLDNIMTEGGGMADSLPCNSLIFDRQPPFIMSISPDSLLNINTSDVLISAETSDSVCGLLDSYLDMWSVTFYNQDGDFITTYSTLDDPLYIEGIFDGYLLDVCAVISDDCADYCPSNTDTFCWSYDVDLREPYGELLRPTDSNDDGDIILNCDDLELVFRFESSYGIDLDYVRLILDDEIYEKDDFYEFTHSGDSTVALAIWMPDTGLTENVEIDFSLDSLLDNSGKNITMPISESFIIDTKPPIFNIDAPEETFINESSFNIAIEAHDSICGDVAVDSIIIMAEPSGLLERYYADTSISLSGYENGDSIHIIAFADDDCIDSCGSNMADTILSYFANLSGPVLRPIFPPDSTWSSCDGQEAAFYLFDIIGIDTSTIQMSLDGAGIDDFQYRNDTLYFMPAEPFDSSGIYIIEAYGENYNSIASDTAEINLWLDLQQPYFDETALSPADTIDPFDFYFEYAILDDHSGIDIDSIEMTIDGIETSFDFDGELISFELDSTLITGRFMQIGIIAQDQAQFCGGNRSEILLEYFIKGFADLEIISLTDSISEDSIYISCQFRNSGIADCDSFKVAIFLNSDFIYEEFYDRLNTGNIAQIEYTIPSSPGNHEICVLLDYNDKIAESDESNNRDCIEVEIAEEPCDVSPSPFTPNNDGKNDLAIFNFPNIENSNYRITIFDMQNRMVKEILPPNAVWDGYDSSSAKMQQGIYLYIVEVGDSIICRGTVYLAR
ncbi:MAG: T9SS type B sorting domain-containing protein [Candidatus Zixiibacteriota bacterium]